MDINEAALKLAKIEIIKAQVEHLQSQAAACHSLEWEGYCIDCNEKAQELIRMLNVNSLFQ